MYRLWVAAVLFATTGLGFVAANDSAWRIRSYLDEPQQLCDGAGVELIVRSQSGESLVVHRVAFGDTGVLDDELPIPLKQGTFSLEVFRVDCAGLRARVAEISTEVTAATRAKQIYIAAAAHGGSVDPRYVEVDTYADAVRVSARREGSTLVLTNLGASAIRLCGRPSVQAIRDEFLFGQEWESHSTLWGIPPDVSAIEPGSELILRSSIIKKYIAPNSSPKKPDAARVMLAIKPGPSHVILGEIPLGFIGFPGCDFVYVSRAITDWDRIWIHEGAER